MHTHRTLVLLALAIALPLGVAPQAVAETDPAAIPGLEAWYRADSLQLNNGDPVKTWPDLSGNGHDLSSDENGLTAVYGVARLNERSVVQVRKANSYSVAAPFSLGEHTLFVVYRTGNTGRALFRSASDEFAGLLLRGDEGRDQIRYGEGRFNAYGSRGPTGGYSVTVLGRQADMLRAFVNGEDVSTGEEYTGTIHVGKFFHLAQSRFSHSDGDGLVLAEVLIYRRYLADAERDELTRYLAQRYGLEIGGAAVEPEYAAAAAPGSLAVAQLSTAVSLDVNEGLVAVPWNRRDELDEPFRHDIRSNTSRLFCVRDETRVRLYVSLPLTATFEGAAVRVLFRVNEGKFLRGEGRSGIFGGPGSASKISVQAEAITTLGSGDYVEVVVLRVGAEGEIKIESDAAVFIAEVR